MLSALRPSLRLLSLSKYPKTIGKAKEISLTSSRFYCNCKMTKTALIILAPGAEEMEFTIAADVLRRAGVSWQINLCRLFLDFAIPNFPQQITVTVAGLNGAEPVKCSRDIVIVPDKSLDQAVCDNQYDAVVLPGGLGGSNAMGESKAVGELLRTQESSGRIIAAICAAPTALAKHGIATGKSVTSYPAMKPQLVDKYRFVLISFDMYRYL